MSMEYLNAWTVNYATYFIAAVYIYRKVTTDIIAKKEHDAFRLFIVSYELYLIANLLCVLNEKNAFSFSRKVTLFIIFFSLFTVMFAAFTLYRFTLIRFFTDHTKMHTYQLFGDTLMAIIFIVLVISLKNGVIFGLDENGHLVYGPGYPVMHIFGLAFFAWILSIIIREYSRSHSYIKRQQMITSTYAVLYILVAIVINSFFPIFTTLPPGFLFVIIILYINQQESIIYTDVLTGMNNRRKANEHIGLQLLEVSEEKPLYLFMCDVNAFKQINDEYGHLEGDKALIIVSDVLKEVIDRYHGFAARYGGDEFILYTEPLTTENLNSQKAQYMINDIQNLLAERCKSAGKPYSLSMSMGYVCCNDSKYSLSEYVKKADEMLYENKRAWHLRH